MLTKEIEHYLYLAAITIGSFGVGFLIEKLTINRLHKFAERTAWKFDDILFSSLNGIISTCAMLLGYTIAMHSLDLPPQFRALSHKIAFSILILIGCIFVIRILVKGISQRTSNGDPNMPSSSIILNIIRVSIVLIGGMLILQTFGVSIAPILTALGVGGLAVALALQETLSNLFAGIQIIASKKIRNGDYVKLDSGQEGIVMDITWRNTVIQALQNNVIIVPNAKLSSAIVTNFNFPQPEMTLPVAVGVSYDSDLEKVERISIEVAKEVLGRIEGGVKDFDPTVRFHTFGGSSIDFNVGLRVTEFANQFLIKSEFIKTLHKRFNEENIEIPFPIRTVILKKEEGK